MRSVADLEAENVGLEKEWSDLNDYLHERRWPKDDYLKIRHDMHQIERRIAGNKDLIRFKQK